MDSDVCIISSGKCDVYFICISNNTCNTSCRYHAPYCPDGKTPWSPELKWGYLAEQCYHARFHWPVHPVYQNILSIIRTKDSDKSFVISTNADGMFKQNNFDPERVYNPQGDYSNLQCLRPCREDAYWPSEPIVTDIVPTIDKNTQKCPPSKVPLCPHCGGPAFYNVRGGNWFIEDVNKKQRDFSNWLKSTVNQKLVILEVGVGFNTPSVLRWPVEDMVESNANCKLIRINLEHPEVPDSIEDRSVCIPANAAESIDAIYESFKASV
jgi:NAD-dependent SIR2 family protein deacetylase